MTFLALAAAIGIYAPIFGGVGQNGIKCFSPAEASDSKNIIAWRVKRGEDEVDGNEAKVKGNVARNGVDRKTSNATLNAGLAYDAETELYSFFFSLFLMLFYAFIPCFCIVGFNIAIVNKLQNSFIDDLYANSNSGESI